jgi:hypothetical protein
LNPRSGHSFGRIVVILLPAAVPVRHLSEFRGVNSKEGKFKPIRTMRVQTILRSLPLVDVGSPELRTGTSTSHGWLPTLDRLDSVSVEAAAGGGVTGRRLMQSDPACLRAKVQYLSLYLCTCMACLEKQNRWCLLHPTGSPFTRRLGKSRNVRRFPSLNKKKMKKEPRPVGRGMCRAVILRNNEPRFCERVGSDGDHDASRRHRKPRPSTVGCRTASPRLRRLKQAKRLQG